MNSTGHAAGTVSSLLRTRAAESPAATAFQTESRPGEWAAVTWQAFAQHVEHLRQALHAAGVRKGDRIALIAPVSLEWELIHHAVLSLGGVLVGLDAHDLPERLGQMAEQADIAAFVTSDLRVLRGVEPRRLASSRFVMRLGGPDVDLPEGTRLLAWPAAGVTDGSATASAPSQSPEPDDLAAIIFTSGTTGLPKGIAYSHRQLCLAVEAIADIFSFTGTHSRLLCWLPLSNLFQRVVNLAAVRQGAATYLLGDPRRVMEVVGGVSPEVFIGVPRFYEKLHDGLRQNIAARPRPVRALVGWAWGVGCRAASLQRAGDVVPAGLRWQQRMAERLVLRRLRGLMGDRLRCMVTGSAPAPVQLLESFHGLGWLVLEAYGLSENVLPMAMNRIDRFRFGTVGVPLEGNDIRLDSGGVVEVRSAGLFNGYIGDPGSQVGADGYYRTGDIGSVDSDGFLRLVGRNGDLIKTSTGRRVAPSGVEARLRGIDGIEHAMLLGQGRKAVVALCTLEPAARHGALREQVIRALQADVRDISEFERPVGVVLIEQPLSIEAGDLTPNLKLRRSAIEARHASAVEQLYRAVDSRKPDDPLLVTAA